MGVEAGSMRYYTTRLAQNSAQALAQRPVPRVRQLRPAKWSCFHQRVNSAPLTVPEVTHVSVWKVT